jgi:hypothetical protein
MKTITERHESTICRKSGATGELFASRAFEMQTASKPSQKRNQVEQCSSSSIGHAEHSMNADISMASAFF